MEARRLLGALLVVIAVAVAIPSSAGAQVVDDNPAAISRGPFDVLVFARGSDGAIHMRSGIDGTWRSLGGVLTSGPAVSLRADGTVDVFARGTNKAIYHLTVKGDTASSWESLGGSAATGPGAVKRRNTSYIDLFYASAGRDLKHRYYDGGTKKWSAEASLGEAVISAPAPSSRLTNWLDVFVRSAAGNVFNRSYRAADGWTPYSKVDHTTSAALSVISRAEGDLDIFARGGDNRLYQRHYDRGNGYRGWEMIDPQPLSSGPAATIDGPTRVHLFARSGTDVIAKSWESGKGWTAWRNIGPVAPPAPPAPPPPPPPPPPAPPTPVGGGNVELNAGLSCTPRGERMSVNVKVRKRAGRAKPRVIKVVFYYRRGKRKVARTDRRAPYRRTLLIDLRPGTYRVYARISYKRPGKRRVAIKTVSKRFAVCA